MSNNKRKALSKYRRNKIMEKYDFKCAKCGGEYPETPLIFHHVIPIIKGGSNEINNIIPLCRSCHHKEHNEGWKSR